MTRALPLVLAFALGHARNGRHRERRAPAYPGVTLDLSRLERHKTGRTDPILIADHLQRQPPPN
jgi:hypothetical protein